jgi:hypothetical protein
VLVGLFLVYLAAFIAALFAIQWLLDFLASATMTGSVEALAAAGGMGAIAVLIRHDLGGIVIAVAIMVFWFLLLFGAGSPYLTSMLTVAAAALYAAAAVTLMESFRGDA